MHVKFLSHMLAACFLVPTIGVMPIYASDASVNDKDIAVKEDKKEKAQNRVPGPMISPEAWPGGQSIPKGVFAVINHVTMSHGKAYKGNSRHTNYDPAGNKVGPKSNELFVDVVKLRYGFGDGWDLRTSTPYINNEVTMHSSQTGSVWKGGVGDTTVILRKQLNERTDSFPFCFAVDLGLVTPTGQTGNKDKYLATNALGVVGGGGASWIDYNQRVDIDMQYKYFTEGKHNITPDSVFLSHLHYAYALSRYFDLGTETWIRVESSSKVDGHTQNDSFTELYAGPKMQIKIQEWQNLHIGAAILFPVYRHYESTKLSTDTRYEFRVSISF